MSSKHFIPLGYTVLVQPDPVDEKIGSIVVVKETRESDMNARMTGEVLAISDAAFAGDHEVNKGKVAVGDRVLYRRYSGVKVEDRTDEIEQPRVLVNDIDILAKMIDDD
jgi:co-chaperonin GroES (HSP10)